MTTRGYLGLGYKSCSANGFYSGGYYSCMVPIVLFYKIVLTFMGHGNGNGGMHRRVEWMVPADSSILRFMDAVTDERGNPAIQTPKTISLNTGYSNKHVANRCRTLADHGLLERVEDKAQYRITDKGHALLDGGIDPSDL